MEILCLKRWHLRNVFLLLLLLPITVYGNGNQQKITVKGKSLTLRQVIKAIEKNSDYTFFFKANDIDDLLIKNINCTGTIQEILPIALDGTNLKYVIKDKEIILMSKEPEQHPKSQKKDSQQKRIITGIIIDAENGDPIIGASIIIKGQKEGVISDLDGHFSISVSSSKSQLEISYIGYRKQLVDVGDLGVLHIKMESDNQMLNEVVVVGAGTQKKVSVTGSITSVKGLELKSPSSSLTSSFAGKLAGVISMSKSGEPGSASEFYIRGVSTFGGRATPLIMLDDVEISASDLNNIPAEIIESFSILKDASATAIYGARGANGVMLVKTKDGRENEKTSINVTVENSFNQPMNFPEFVDGATWMDMYNEALITRNPNTQKKYLQPQIDATRSHLNPYIYPDVNWGNLIFKDFAVNQRANLSVQGGGTKATYFMSVQVNHDTGLLSSPNILF